MERRGSGLRKIIDQYPKNAAPMFRSTEQSFIVTLKNLNYGKVFAPDGVDNGDDVGIDKNARLVLSAIAENPKITQIDIANSVGLSARTVSREMKRLRDIGVLHRVGSDRAGCWEIAQTQRA
jgi:ATP-dependent DNA helicase RecG